MRPIGAVYPQMAEASRPRGAGAGGRLPRPADAGAARVWSDTQRCGQAARAGDRREVANSTRAQPAVRGLAHWPRRGDRRRRPGQRRPKATGPGATTGAYTIPACRPARTMLLAGLAFLTFFVALGRPAITDSDEAFYAQAGREMVETGDWVTPRYNGEYRFEKPVMFYWLVAPGLPPGRCRRVRRALAVGAGRGSALVLAAFACARRWYDDDTALFAGAVTATSFGFVGWARQALPDLALACFITTATWAAFEALVVPRAAGERRRRWLAAAGVALAAAVLNQGSGRPRPARARGGAAGGLALHHRGTLPGRRPGVAAGPAGRRCGPARRDLPGADAALVRGDDRHPRGSPISIGSSSARTWHASRPTATRSTRGRSGSTCRSSSGGSCPGRR